MRFYDTLYNEKSHHLSDRSAKVLNDRSTAYILHRERKIKNSSKFLLLYGIMFNVYRPFSNPLD